MLLDRAGYEFRTVSINDSQHGYIGVKFDGQWNLLDPTVNIWYDKSTIQLNQGIQGKIKEFFMQAEGPSNQKARENLTAGLGCDIFCLKNQMLSIGSSFEANIDKYNYIDLTQYQY